jgi:hypothetical protein
MAGRVPGAICPGLKHGSEDGFKRHAFEKKNEVVQQRNAGVQGTQEAAQLAVVVSSQRSEGSGDRNEIDGRKRRKRGQGAARRKLRKQQAPRAGGAVQRAEH